MTVSTVAFKDPWNCCHLVYSQDHPWDTEGDEHGHNGHHDLGHGAISIGAGGNGSLGANEDSVVEEAEDNDREETCGREDGTAGR